MKNYLSILLLLISIVTFGQIQTQVNGWNALITLPTDYNFTTIKYPTIVFFPGLGEVGTDINKLRQNGPHAYIASGGQIPGFIVISLQPSYNYPRPPAVNQRLDSLIKWYRIDTLRINLTGLSHGGWVSWIYSTYKPTATTNYKLIKSVIDVEGGYATDTYEATLAGRARYAEYANRGGRGLGFEQVQDYRGMQNIDTAMNGAVLGSFKLTYTNFGNGGHCCWNRFYGGQGIQPSTFLINGIQQNIYQWLTTRNVLVVTSIDTTKPIRPNKISEFYFDRDFIYLKVNRQTNWNLYNTTGQLIQKGTQRVGTNKISLINLKSGVYYLQTELKTYKILKF